MRRADISRERSLQHGDDHARLGRECGWRRRRVGLDRPFRLQRFARREQHVRIVSDGLWRRRRRSRQRSGQRWRGGRRLGPFCSRHHGIELGGGFRGQGRRERQSSGGRNSDGSQCRGGRRRHQQQHRRRFERRRIVDWRAGRRIGFESEQRQRLRRRGVPADSRSGARPRRALQAPATAPADQPAQAMFTCPAAAGEAAGPGSGSTAGGTGGAGTNTGGGGGGGGSNTGGGGTGGKGGDGFAVVRAWSEVGSQFWCLRWRCAPRQRQPGSGPRVRARRDGRRTAPATTGTAMAIRAR